MLFSLPFVDKLITNDKYHKIRGTKTDLLSECCFLEISHNNWGPSLVHHWFLIPKMQWWLENSRWNIWIDHQFKMLVRLFRIAKSAGQELNTLWISFNGQANHCEELAFKRKLFLNIFWLHHWGLFIINENHKLKNWLLVMHNLNQVFNLRMTRKFSRSLIINVET